MSLAAANLADILGQVMSVEVTDDDALTVQHDGTFASLRTVTIAEPFTFAAGV